MSSRLTTARTVEEVDALRETWAELGPRDPNADPDVLLTLLEARDGILRPHVVAAQTDAGRALLVGRLERTRLPVRLGYLRLYSPEVRALTVVQGGALGDGGEALRAVLAEAARVLETGEADVLRLRALPVGSELHRLARARGTWRTRGRTAGATPRWRLALPGSLDEVLQFQSGKSRGNERRSARKLEQELGDSLSFEVYRDPADVPRVLQECRAVSEKTYQHALGAGFAAGEAERRLLELAAERGWLRAYVLSVAGEPRAFWVGNAYRRVFYAGPTGYDPAIAHLRAGRYVLRRMLDELCRDPEVDELDWGHGDGDYKPHFSTHAWREEDVLLFAPTFRGARLNLTRTAFFRAAAAAQRAGGRVPALRNVKRRWRARLSR